jgi:hypothetical protein
MGTLLFFLFIVGVTARIVRFVQSGGGKSRSGSSGRVVGRHPAQGIPSMPDSGDQKRVQDPALALLGKSEP